MNPAKNVNSQLDIIHANFQQHQGQHWRDCYNDYCKSHRSSHQVRVRYIGLEDTSCSVCEHKWHGYLSCSWIRPVVQKEKEFQANQPHAWNQAVLSTIPLTVVETMEEPEICNARITPNTLQNTIVSASPTPQAGLSNHTTTSVTTRFHNRPKKQDVAKPTPINTNLTCNHCQCVFFKRFSHIGQTGIKNRETLNDLNNYI